MNASKMILAALFVCGLAHANEPATNTTAPATEPAATAPAEAGKMEKAPMKKHGAAGHAKKKAAKGGHEGHEEHM